MKLIATTEQLAKCWYNWQSGHHADAKGQRLGQYIWNCHGKQDDSWPELFYEYDPTKAYIMAMLDVLSSMEAVP